MLSSSTVACSPVFGAASTATLDYPYVVPIKFARMEYRMPGTKTCTVLFYVISELFHHACDDVAMYSREHIYYHILLEYISSLIIFFLWQFLIFHTSIVSPAAKLEGNQGVRYPLASCSFSSFFPSLHFFLDNGTKFQPLH
jgi:hypothetical protein